jgi:hypothetical protein
MTFARLPGPPLGGLGGLADFIRWLATYLKMIRGPAKSLLSSPNIDAVATLPFDNRAKALASYPTGKICGVSMAESDSDAAVRLRTLIAALSKKTVANGCTAAEARTAAAKVVELRATLAATEKAAARRAEEEAARVREAKERAEKERIAGEQARAAHWERVWNERARAESQQAKSAGSGFLSDDLLNLYKGANGSPPGSRPGRRPFSPNEPRRITGRTDSPPTGATSGFGRSTGFDPGPLDYGSTYPPKSPSWPARPPPAPLPKAVGQSQTTQHILMFGLILVAVCLGWGLIQADLTDACVDNAPWMRGPFTAAPVCNNFFVNNKTFFIPIFFTSTISVIYLATRSHVRSAVALAVLLGYGWFYASAYLRPRYFQQVTNHGFEQVPYPIDSFFVTYHAIVVIGFFTCLAFIAYESSKNLSAETNVKHALYVISAILAIGLIHSTMVERTWTVIYTAQGYRSETFHTQDFWVLHQSLMTWIFVICVATLLYLWFKPKPVPARSPPPPQNLIDDFVDPQPFGSADFGNADAVDRALRGPGSKDTPFRFKD